MGALEVIFGTVVVVLAGIAVIGALTFAVIWEVCAIKRTLAAHRVVGAGTTTFVWKGYGSSHRVPDGTYRVVARATDPAGNATTARSHVRVDTTRGEVSDALASVRDQLSGLV